MEEGQGYMHTGKTWYNLVAKQQRLRSLWPQKALFGLVNAVSLSSLREFVHIRHKHSLKLGFHFGSLRSRSRWPHQVCLCFIWIWYLKISSKECLQIWDQLSFRVKDELIRCRCLEVKGQGHSYLMLRRHTSAVWSF